MAKITVRESLESMKEDLLNSRSAATNEADRELIAGFASDNLDETAKNLVSSMSIKKNARLGLMAKTAKVDNSTVNIDTKTAGGALFDDSTTLQDMLMDKSRADDVGSILDCLVPANEVSNDKFKGVKHNGTVNIPYKASTPVMKKAPKLGDPAKRKPTDYIDKGNVGTKGWKTMPMKRNKGNLLCLVDSDFICSYNGNGQISTSEAFYTGLVESMIYGAQDYVSIQALRNDDLAGPNINTKDSTEEREDFINDDGDFTYECRGVGIHTYAFKGFYTCDEDTNWKEKQTKRPDFGTSTTLEEIVGAARRYLYRGNSANQKIITSVGGMNKLRTLSECLTCPPGGDLGAGTNFQAMPSLYGIGGGFAEIDRYPELTDENGYECFGTVDEDTGEVTPGPTGENGENNVGEHCPATIVDFNSIYYTFGCNYIPSIRVNTDCGFAVSLCQDYGQGICPPEKGRCAAIGFTLKAKSTPFIKPDSTTAEDFPAEEGGEEGGEEGEG